MKNNHCVAIIISLLSVLLCSCQPQYKIVLKDVNITNIALDETEFDSKVWVTCKWFRSIKLTNITYELYHDNKKFGEGVYPGEIILGKNADTMLYFPCTARNMSTALPFIGSLIKGDFDYEVRMTLKVKAWIYQKRITTNYFGSKKMW